jgi:hypothetical protein
VKDALQEAKAVVILCSKESIGRPWVNFEAGAAWLRDVPIIPVCHTDLKPNDLPLPLTLLQVVEANQPAGIKQLYARLAKIIEANEPQVEHAHIADAVKECEQEFRKARTDGTTLDRILRPRILCAASKQYAIHCEYDKDLAVIREAFPDSIVVAEGALTTQRLCDLLSDQHFDLIHLISFVDPQTGALVLSDIDLQTMLPVGGSSDRLTANGFAQMVEFSRGRLVVLASCDSLRLGAQLARGTNLVAAYSTVQTDEIVAWERRFYRMLSRGHTLMQAYNVSNAASEAPMCLMLKKDMAFAPAPSTDEL